MNRIRRFCFRRGLTEVKRISPVVSAPSKSRRAAPAPSLERRNCRESRLKPKIAKNPKVFGSPRLHTSLRSPHHSNPTNGVGPSQTKFRLLKQTANFFKSVIMPCIHVHRAGSKLYDYVGEAIACRQIDLANRFQCEHAHKDRHLSTYN